MNNLKQMLNINVLGPMVGLVALLGAVAPVLAQEVECESYADEDGAVAVCVDEDGNTAVSTMDDEGNQVTIVEDEDGNQYTEIIEADDDY